MIKYYPVSSFLHQGAGVKRSKISSIICIFNMELRNINSGGVIMGKNKPFNSEASKNQSLIDNSRDSRNAKNGYKDRNPAEIAAAARARTTKHPDSTDM